MTRLEPATRLTVLVGEDDQHGGHPVYAEIVHRAQAAGMAGASVVRGQEGFGRSRRLHTARLLSLAQDLPVAVVIVDAADRIEAFLPEVEELVDGGLITLDEVRVLRGTVRA